MVERECEVDVVAAEPAAEPPREQLAPTMLDALVWPGDTATWLRSCPPSGEAISALAAIDPATLTHDRRIDLLTATRRAQAWLAGLEQRLLAALAAGAGQLGSPLDPTGKSYVTDEVAAALRLHPLTAQKKLDIATALHGPLTATGTALATGTLTYAQAATIAEETDTDTLTTDQRRGIEADLLPRAGTLTVGDLRRRTRRAVATASPCDTQLAHTRALRDRRVSIRPAEHGMSTLWALLPADAATALMAALDAAADRDHHTPDPDGHPRTRDQRRADALTALAWTALADPELPRRHRARPTITVAISLSTLLACSDTPGQLTGYGPIPAAMARRIAAEPHATWRRLLVDDRGHALDYGRTTYRPPADLTDYTITRDRTCVFPGCTRQARDADLDHHTDWNHGGHTNPDNLGPLCPRHHQMKHDTNWTVWRDHHGNTHWRSPTGHTYTHEPDPYPTDDWHT